MRQLEPQAVRDALAILPGWSGDGHGLETAWRFPSFPAAIDFIAACVQPIVAMDHHPEWTNVHDRVGVRLRTHAAGDRVTDLDVDLARLLDGIARGSGGRPC